MQVATVVGPLSTTSGGQVVVVQLLTGAAGDGEHVLTATLLVLAFEQTTFVHALPRLGDALVQEGTGTLLVTIGDGHVVSTQLLIEVGPDTVHVCTGTLVVVRIGQIVAVYAFPMLADATTHDPTGVRGELLTEQEVVV
jgi:hypothetical protein